MISVASRADGAGPLSTLRAHLVLHSLHPLSIWLCWLLMLCLLMRRVLYQLLLSARRWGTNDPAASLHARVRRFARARSFWLPFSAACCTLRLLLCIQEPFWRFQELEGLLFAFLICQTSASGCHWILTSVNRLKMATIHLPRTFTNEKQPAGRWQKCGVLRQHARTFVGQKNHTRSN